MTTTRQESLQKIGESAMDSIRDMVAALDCDYDRLEELRNYCADEDYQLSDEEAEELADLEAAASGTGNVCESCEYAERQITEDALSAQVRSDWEDSAGDFTPAEFCLLLTTGGPAVRIIGDLQNGEPTRARLEVQDWGTPWTEHCTTGDDNAALLNYARCFFFGE